MFTLWDSHVLGLGEGLYEIFDAVVFFVVPSRFLACLLADTRRGFLVLLLGSEERLC